MLHGPNLKARFVVTDTTHVRRMLDVLRDYYADKDGNKRVLNATQITFYSSALARYSPEELSAAAQAWIAKSKFFPAVSDLLEMLNPTTDWPALSHMALATVEDAIRKGGAYRGARFCQGAIGEAVRQTFGTWATACSFETDSPGWAIRRQTFLAVFPALARREYGPVILRGLHANVEPYEANQVAGLPAPKPFGEFGEVSQPEAKALLAHVAELASRKQMP